MDYLILLLLPLGIGIGWLLASWLKGKNASMPGISNKYFRGLNYLINEEQDKAIDIFVQMLEDNPETVETHIALGALFRRRGETARAISIHENIMHRANLSDEQRLAAQMELGRDYMRAGLLDRAEVPFSELSTLPDYRYAALKFLNEIYDQEQDWDRAIKIAKQLDELEHDAEWHVVIAHYYCEKAEIALANKEYAESERFLTAALEQYVGCVRANFIWARLYEDKAMYKEAVGKYKRIEYQNPGFLSEALPGLIKAYEKFAETEEIIDYLQRLVNKHPSTTLLLALVGKMTQKYGEREAENILINSLQNKPSVRGLEYLIALNLRRIKNEGDKAKLMGLQRMMRQLQEEKPLYKCETCGFEARQMHWQCPGCRSWSSILPIIGVSGE